MEYLKKSNQYSEETASQGRDGEKDREGDRQREREGESKRSCISKTALALGARLGLGAASTYQRANRFESKFDPRQQQQQ